MSKKFESVFLQEIVDRGVFNQCTELELLDKHLNEKTVTAYVGFDATASSLHVGHLVTLVTLRRFVSSGHRAIVLIGGGTSLVGDPSFRSSTRPMLDLETLGENINGITRDIKAVLGDLSDRVIFVNNADWINNFGFLEFMRNIGTHFTVSRMISMDCVKGRLDEGGSISALEFSYMMLQAADFLELSRRNDCTLQIGGSDQWGNIINGIELARKSDRKQLFGLTTKLLTTSDGKKMGKTADGAVWLSPEKMPPFDFWQFWRNVDDGDVSRFLLMFSNQSINDINKLISSQENINRAKEMLATEVTGIVHGLNAAADAKRQADALFLGKAKADLFEIVCSDDGIGIQELLVNLNVARSKNMARKLIEGRGVKLNGDAVSDSQIRLKPSKSSIVLSVGKRRKFAVSFKA